MINLLPHVTTLQIGDFGISKILTSKSKASTVVGTPSYISPELCEGRPYDQKSDVWSLGCILYEMCALQRAFQAPSLPALVLKIMRGRIQPLPSHFSSLLKGEFLMHFYKCNFFFFFQFSTLYKNANSKNRRNSDPYSNAFSRCLQFAHKKKRRASRRQKAKLESTGAFLAQKIQTLEHGFQEKKISKSELDTTI